MPSSAPRLALEGPRRERSGKSWAACTGGDAPPRLASGLTGADDGIQLPCFVPRSVRRCRQVAGRPTSREVRRGHAEPLLESYTTPNGY
jgi:hypothetical protein